MILLWFMSRVFDGCIDELKKIFLQFSEQIWRVVRQIARNYDLLLKNINYFLLHVKYNLPLPDT